MTETTPLDVAVQADEIERHKYALSLAVKHGYADKPEAFASRLKGDSVEELDADAAEFAAGIADIRALLAPPRVMAVDPSQGRGTGKVPDSPANALGEMMRDQLGVY